ncbi:protein FATTY ACID EXPORT 4, chloroplastic [Camellia sinensis]|uniref:Uncharacterized protein n=1 Tax=Camellia sinensis var. sinensis TaxID=542762 RepID=A0A4S4E0S0_CAMSN|nr:protein FATTY ACID EXPORT 4, chloroplastic [Camellia sinensis]THG09388.1 hypothetical protein TEA_013804 [Camellia sinensis var. sinensis]
MASCQCRCVCLIVIPAAATNTPPKFPLSSILELRGSTGIRRRFSGISSPSPSFSFRGRQRQCLLFNINSESTCTTSGPFHRCNSQLGGDLAPATSAAYGVLLLVGGLFAYTRTGSKGSLLGGLTGGSLMAAAYFLMQASEMKEIGDALAFGSTFLFASVFGIRLAATRKIIPAGPLLGLSICALAVFISAYLQDKSLM